VRRALAHAIDRRAIIRGAMYGYGVPIAATTRRTRRATSI